MAVPNHIAFLCDGNRRWAKARGMSPLEGHRSGLSDFTNLINYFTEKGVSALTFFIFSTENWNRSDEEVSFLMSLYEKVFDNYEKADIAKRIKFQTIGRRDRIPVPLLKNAEKLERTTAGNTKGTVAFALDYGGQDEIVRAANAAIIKGKPVDAAAFGSFLDGGLPPVDLVVRTSQEIRISNFMLWHMAYAEFLFIPQFWPEYVESQPLWEETLKEYENRNRRFGGGVEKHYAEKNK